MKPLALTALLAAALTLTACASLSSSPASAPTLTPSPSPAAATTRATTKPKPASPAPLTLAQERGLSCWQVIHRDGYANELAAGRSPACMKVSTAKLNELLAREDRDASAG